PSASSLKYVLYRWVTFDVPKVKNQNLQVLTDLDQIKTAFNKESRNFRFVAILSSTCGWCLQGAQAVQKTVVENMSDKDISVIIIWTNMLKSDDKESAYYAASMFEAPSVVQFFDADNKFGDMVARKLSPQGQ